MLSAPSPCLTLCFSRFSPCFRAARSNDVLENALKTVSETEEVGAGITEELARNRDKIRDAHGKVRDVDSLTGTAKKLLGRMQARDKRTKMIMYCVFAFVFLAIFIVFYMTVIGGGSEDTPAPAPPPLVRPPPPPPAITTYEI